MMVIGFDQSEVDLATKLGHKATLCDADNLLETVEENISDDDLVINFVTDITQAMLLNIVIRKAGPNRPIEYPNFFGRESMVINAAYTGPCI